MTDDVTVTVFHAEWCGPCTQQEQKFEDFGFEDRVDASVDHVDVETDDGQDRASVNEVRSLPTTIIFEDDDEAQRFIGVTKPAKIVSTVERLTGEE